MFGLLASAPRLSRRWRAEAGDHVIAVAFSPDGKTLAAASVAGPVALFDAAGGKAVRELSGHGFGTSALAWRPDGSALATAGQDGKARLWDAVTGAAFAELAGGAAWVECVAWHPTAGVVVTGAGKKLKVFDASGALRHDLPDLPATVTDLAWRPRTGELTAATYGGVRLFDAPAGRETERLDWKGSVLRLAWSPDGGRLAHGNQDATVHYWFVNGRRDLQMAGYPMKVREVCFDPSGRYLATGGGDVVTVWDTKPPGPEGSQPLSFDAHKGAVTALAYQGRGPLLASGGQDGVVHLWRPGKFRKSVARAEAGGAVSRLAWSPRDDALAAGTESGAVVLFSVG